MDSDKFMFETGLARLEQIVRRLESGNTPLDEALELYEEGVSLVKKCTGELENAEKKIKILVASPDGITEEDFGS